MLFNSQTITAIGIDLLKFAEDPISRRTDAARRIILLGQSVPRAEGNELPNRCLDILRRNFLDHFGDFGIRFFFGFLGETRRGKNV